MTGKSDDYVLGVNAAEIDRLALQHRVWRERALGLWRRGGLRPDASALDIGCGPGWAAVDLAEIVGPQGRVVGIDRAPAYVAHARRMAEARGLPWLTVLEADLPAPLPIGAPVDFVWCRWVLAFTRDRTAALNAIAAVVRPGGVLAIQEYLHYRAWSLAPPHPAFSRFTDGVVASWRREGGEPDVALELPQLLDAAGFDVVAFDAFADIVRPSDPMWDWLAAFARSGSARLVELSELSEAEAAAHLAAFEEAERRGAHMATPVTGHVLARRR